MGILFFCWAWLGLRILLCTTLLLRTNQSWRARKTCLKLVFNYRILPYIFMTVNFQSNKIIWNTFSCHEPGYSSHLHFRAIIRINDQLLLCWRTACDRVLVNWALHLQVICCILSMLVVRHLTCSSELTTSEKLGTCLKW